MSRPFSPNLFRELGVLTAVVSVWLATALTARANPPALAQVGIAYQSDFSVTGSPKSASSYTVTGLPSGLSVVGATFSAGTNTYALNAPFGTITGTPTADGNFSLSVTAWEFANQSGSSRTYAYTIAVSPAPASAPVITMQPVGQTATVGSPVTFAVAASGSPSPSFQWQKDNVAIAGATDSTFTILNAVASDAGTYSVVAGNAAGSVVSSAAVLTVNPLAIIPFITTQPIGRTTIIGGAVTFTVVAGGTPAPTMQWRKEGVDISGATGPSYSIASVGADDAGNYTVVATNAAGAVTSDRARLILDVIPAGFDLDAYLVRYPDVAAIYGTDRYGAWLHYRDEGIYRGEIFDELFRVEEYLALYAELFALFGDDLRGALLHWLNTGRIEGRLGRIPLEFSAAGYFARNPDVAAAVGGNTVLAWGHYWSYGIYEGRAYDDELRVFEYLAINADLTTAFVNDWRAAALHWMRYGRSEGRLGRLPLTFRVSGYLGRNADVAAAWGTDPTTVFLHFWLYGIEEARTYDDLFRVDDYLALNPDLAAVFGSDRRGAFKHWVRYGQVEGRRAKNP